MMIHESIHQMSSLRRRSLANTMLARKVSGQEASGSYTLRQRLGNRGVQRLMSEIIGHSRAVYRLVPLRSRRSFQSANLAMCTNWKPTA